MFLVRKQIPTIHITNIVLMIIAYNIFIACLTGWVSLVQLKFGFTNDNITPMHALSSVYSNIATHTYIETEYSNLNTIHITDADIKDGITLNKKCNNFFALRISYVSIGSDFKIHRLFPSNDIDGVEILPID